MLTSEVNSSYSNIIYSFNQNLWYNFILKMKNMWFVLYKAYILKYNFKNHCLQLTSSLSTLFRIMELKAEETNKIMEKLHLNRTWNRKKMVGIQRLTGLLLCFELKVSIVCKNVANGSRLPGFESAVSTP